jgi:hypothetical protein
MGWMSHWGWRRAPAGTGNGRAGAGPATGTPALTFEVRTQAEPHEGGAMPPCEMHLLKVRLGQDYLCVEQDDRGDLYDFAHDRVYRLQPASRTYVVGSVYEDLAFRVMELQNRKMLASVLAAGEVKDNPLEPAFNEHALSLLEDGSRTQIDERHEGTQRVFRWRSHVLFAISDDVAPLPTGDMAGLWRFLRYHIGGHPAIYARLADVRGVPMRIERRIAGADARTTTLALTGVELRPNAPYTLDGWRPAADGDAEPQRTVAGVPADAAAQRGGFVQSVVAARDAATASNRWLDAMLLNFEAMFADGDDARSVAWVRGHHAALRADPDAQAVSTAMGTPMNATPGDLEAAVAALDALQAADPAHRHLLDVFAGNLLLAAGRRAEGIERLLRVLRARPLLAGPWADLGSAYAGGYRVAAAWQCWGAARAIAPAHRLLEGPAAFERQLRDRHPDYF